jgi:hypothetical protein
MIEDFARPTEILAHAQWNMDGRDFNVYCLNRWRSVDEPDYFDSYHAEKFAYFKRDIVGYLTSLSGEAYDETLLGLSSWYKDHKSSIDEVLRNARRRDVQ